MGRYLSSCEINITIPKSRQYQSIKYIICHHPSNRFIQITGTFVKPLQDRGRMYGWWVETCSNVGKRSKQTVDRKGV